METSYSSCFRLFTFLIWLRAGSDRQSGISGHQSDRPSGGLAQLARAHP